MNLNPGMLFNFLRNQGHPRPIPATPEHAEAASAVGLQQLLLKSPSTRRISNDEAFGRIAPRVSSPLPYEIPDSTGRSWIMELPEEVLIRVFMGLDGVSLARCMRVSRTFRDLLSTNPHLALQNLLSFSSLRLNSNALIPNPDKPMLSPPSPAELLTRLRNRLDRLGRLDPSRTTSMRLQETEGNLYEYLEGILLKGVGPAGALSKTMAVYDLRGVGDHVNQVDRGGNHGGDGVIQGSEEVGEEDEEGMDEDGAEDEWEEVEDGDEIVEKIRRTKKFEYSIAEFAVDPGQDLLILVEVKPTGARQFTIYFHLLSLETLEPHPLASQPILEWPTPTSRRAISLGFQICDDGLFVLNHNIRSGQSDQICGWQWTTGRLAVTLKAFPTMTFESFILLSPNSLLVPTIITHLDPESTTQDDLNNPSDLSWTHHLHLYAFPPLSSTSPSSTSSEPTPPPHSVTHIATFDLPEFVVDLMDEMPPPRMTIRTDPPPRNTFPIHPIDKIKPFSPHPESGVIILEFFCQLPNNQFPHYVMACPKRTLIQYLPAPTSPLLKQAWPRQAPVIQWETLAPKVRMFGPDLKHSSWVCYVYQDRYAASTSSRRDFDDPLDYNAKIRLYDFNPLRVKRELLRRASNLPSSTAEQSSPSSSIDMAGSPPSSSSPTSPISRRSGLRSISFFSPSNTSSTAVQSIPQYLNPMSPETISALDGGEDGVTLIVSESIIKRELPLAAEVRTGREFPYTFVEKVGQAEVLLLDDERLVAVYTPDLEGRLRGSKSRIEVMEF